MDEDFDTASFDEAYDISDFGTEAGEQAFTTDEMAPVTGTPFGGGNFVDVGLGDDGDSLSSIINPALGSGNRTNITNVGGGSNLVYDPAFAAALDISQGLDPTNNLGGTGGVMVPASLRPQIEGEFYDPFGDKPMFYSQGEKFLQETLPGIVQAGPVARIARGIGNFFGNIFSEGRDFAKDATAGINLPSLREIGEGFTNFMNRFRPERTVTKSDETAVMGSLNPTDRFPSDMRQVSMSPFPITGSEMMSAGIASVRPQQMQDADRNVAEALQLVPSESQNIPIDLGSGIRIAPGSGANRFKFTTSTGANLPGLNPMSNVFDMIDARNLEKEVGRLTDEEREFLAGRRNRIVGTPPRFVTNVS